MQVIAPLSSTADDCFPRARLQPPCPGEGYAGVARKGRFKSAFIITTSCGVFRHVLFPQMFSVGRVIAMVFDGTSSAQSQSDRKSTRLNSSHVAISYAVFCLKKKISHT